MNVSVTRHEEFEVAHLLPKYPGKCKNLHGHTYKIEVTVTGKQDKPFDMVMDFNDLKTAIKKCVPDHKFIFYWDDIIGNEIRNILDLYGLDYECYPFHTTAENMVKFFAEKINRYIHVDLNYPETTFVSKVILYETSNSYASWVKEGE